MLLDGNSVLNYDELVVYDERAIIPAYLIIYKSVNKRNCGTLSPATGLSFLIQFIIFIFESCVKWVV